MDTMYKLTKQIDALTYNSRAVLNALVRSCIAAGTSNGYTVKRYGVKLTLDRADIFRLYDFYQIWANGSYGYEPFTSEPSEFDDIVARCDAKWTSGDQLVTQAIVTHSKILYLVSTNKEQNGADFWLGLIRDSTSPKLVTNSAPIPINLRTPLYDADLSTKSFSQYETYLFPSGYNKISITGMPGDGSDYVGGGKSWLWDIDESFEVTAPRILLGYHSNPQRRVENYRNTKYSLSFGYETYALGERSVALGGRNNIAYGVNSVVAGGANNMSIGTHSMVLSGYVNVSTGLGSVAFGDSSISIGSYSMAGNIGSNAGDFVYSFTIEEPDTAGQVVDCDVIKDTTTGVCLTTGSGSDITSGSGRNTVRIAYNYLITNGLWDLTISTGDTVLIFNQTRKENGHVYKPTDTDGYAFAPLQYRVTNISRSNGDYLIQLSGSIPRGETFLSLWQNGGYIVKYTGIANAINYQGNPISSSSYINPGMASTALNYNTFTPGENQTAVGQMNYGDANSKFMVGTGSSYVGSDAFRRNGLSIAQPYGYMQTADRAAVLGVGNASKYQSSDSGFMARGAWLYHSSSQIGYAGYAIANDARTEIGMYKHGTNTENSQITFVRSGSSYLSENYDVTVCLESRAGSIVINAGSYTGAEHSYDVLLPQGPLRPFSGSNGIAIYSEEGMELRNTNEGYTMSFVNSGYISASFKGLFLHGNTWGAMSTTDEARSFWVYHNDTHGYSSSFGAPGHCVDYPNTIAYSGFYYAKNDWNAGNVPTAGAVNLPQKLNGNWEVHQGRGFHIVNSAVSYINSSGQNGFDVSCLILPGQVKADEMGDPPHLKFINSFIYGTGNGGVMPIETYVTEELAYLRDLDNIRPSSYVSYIGTSTTVKVFYRKLDMQESGSVGYFIDPIYRSATYETGTIKSGTSSDMSGYFGYLKDSPQSLTIQADNDSSLPKIIAPCDYNRAITFNRYGPLVACSLIIQFQNDDHTREFSEFLVVASNSPISSLGTHGSLVLNGTGTGSNDSISVQCTISNTIGQELEISGTKYRTDHMYQFLIRNPGKVKSCRIPITLMGVIN